MVKKLYNNLISITHEVPANPDGNPPTYCVSPTITSDAVFQTNSSWSTPYFPVVTLSINDNIKFLENIKQVPKITDSQNKYRSEVKAQLRNNNLDYMIDPTFKNINRFFVNSCKNVNNDPTRNSFDKYYMPLVF